MCYTQACSGTQPHTPLSSGCKHFSAGYQPLLPLSHGCPPRPRSPPSAIFPSLPHSSCLDASLPAHRKLGQGDYYPPTFFCPHRGLSRELPACSPPATENTELICQILYSGFSQKSAFSEELQLQEDVDKARKMPLDRAKSFADNPQQKHEFISSSILCPKVVNSSSKTQ